MLWTQSDFFRPWVGHRGPLSNGTSRSSRQFASVGDVRHASWRSLLLPSTRSDDGLLTKPLGSAGSVQKGRASSLGAALRIVTRHASSPDKSRNRVRPD